MTRKWCLFPHFRHRRNADGTVSVAPSAEITLEFTYLLLRRVEVPLQAYTCCNSQRSLAQLSSHLQPINVETVATALSSLIVPLATLAFEIFMPQIMRRHQDSIDGEVVTKYAETLQEKCMISILNMCVSSTIRPANVIVMLLIYS